VDLGRGGAVSSEQAPPLFADLVDDAGLFPPEELSMPAALARHQHDEAVGHPVLTGRFLCPSARLDELFAELDSVGRLTLGLISPPDELPAALQRVAAEPRVELAGVEVPEGDLAALAAVPPGVSCYVEFPVADRGRIAQVATAGYGVKVRCGGTRADLFPSAEQLGAFLHEAARCEVPVKATAGLHHALPYRDGRTGFDHHGFLTLLLAACRAIDGGDRADVVAVLRCTDAPTLVREARNVGADLAAATRRVLVGYGSCSTSEPIDDLRALGLIGARMPT
jgi:hypothetical protein